MDPLSVAIIGSGFGGIGMAIRLKQAGVHDFAVLEKDHDVGGTWRDNTYPGAACDVPSHLYSYSFEPKKDWSRRFPPQAEILGYLRHCVRTYGVGPHLRFGCEVTGARFDQDAALWRITTTTGEVTAKVLISACGQLNRPAYPPIEGRRSFRGAAFHSARWDHGTDLTGRRVAVIGTGASAIQFVPRIAAQVEQLHVFQRSAPYVIGKDDRPYTRRERRIFARVPGAQALDRAMIYAALEARVLGFVRYPGLMKLVERRSRALLREQVTDRGLAARLVPDYPAGCKRVLISSDYYPALTRPNVELVTDPISHITPEGIVTRDGTAREVDVIVYGTGFQATDFLAPMKIIGLDGRELSEAWRDGAEAHLGITVTGFPNLFLLYGPNTNLGHNSIIYMLESQIRYVLGCVRAIRRHRLAWVEVRPEVQRAFNLGLQDRFDHTVWTAGCSNWYQTDSGKIVNNWPGTTFGYRKATRRPDPRDYRIRSTAE